MPACRHFSVMLLRLTIRDSGSDVFCRTRSLLTLEEGFSGVDGGSAFVLDSPRSIFGCACLPNESG